MPNIERTVAIVKPGAVSRGFSHCVFNILEKNGGLFVLSRRMVTFNTYQAHNFYAEHNGRPYFDSLVEHTTSGLCIVMLLEGTNAIAKWRELMGPTDPKKALESAVTWSTIRGLYAKTYPGEIVMPDNAVHGSDSPASVERELAILVEGKML